MLQRPPRWLIAGELLRVIREGQGPLPTSTGLPCLLGLEHAVNLQCLWERLLSARRGNALVPDVIVRLCIGAIPACFVLFLFVCLFFF